MNARPRSSRWTRPIVVVLGVSLLGLGSACRMAPRADAPSADSTLLQEQRRRIALFDSVVRSINTDSAYKLWHWTLTLPDAKVGEQQVGCEYRRLMYRYGIAGYYAITRMEDTLMRGADPDLVRQMHLSLRGESLPGGRKECGPLPAEQAPYWLRKWFVYALPQLPPSPTDSAPRHP